MIVVFSIFAIVLIQNNTTVTRQNVSTQANAFAELSTKPLVEAYNLYYDSGYFKFKEVVGKILALGPIIKKVQITDTNGGIVFDSDELQTDHHVPATVAQSLLDPITSPDKVVIPDPTNKNQIQLIVYPYFDDWQAHRYSVIYYVSYNTVQQNAAREGDIIILLAVVFTLLGIVALYSGISRLIVSPIEIVQQGAEKISAGKYDFQVQVNTGDEIQNLAESTNKMAHTLADDIEKLKHLDVLKDEFISLAAHNLRTPVVHIRYDLDYLVPALKGKLDEREKHVIEDVKVSNESLAVLVEDLLNLTTLEKEGMKLMRFGPVDLVVLIGKVVPNFESKIQEKKLHLTIDLGKIEKAEIVGDSPKLAEVLSNLIENAIQFNKPDGSIEIRLGQKGPDYLVAVKDTGIGIKKEELGEVFKKFHRATSYLTYDYSGQGLGLYIAKMIVDAHNGKIWVDSVEGQGSVFYLSFPKKSASSPLPKVKYLGDNS